MKNFKKYYVAVFLAATMALSPVFYACEEAAEVVDWVLEEVLRRLDQTGWLQEQEDMDNIPEDITPFPPDDGNSQPLAGKVLLEDRFPPIGDQGQYGTCVAWSVGYNLKTALNAIEKGWTSADLQKTSNQTSPKDLWMCIPASQKGTQCNGTNFEPALDALITDGAAVLSSVPYTALGNCTGSKAGNAQNKLANYRKIASETEGLTVDNFKKYLNAGRPVAIGAKLGDRFMTWSSPSAIDYDTYNNPGMQHAYHAMALVGYDDAKNAFRVRNSWGSSWGDNGSIWVEYDFFCTRFCFAAFVAQNVTGVSVGSGGNINQGDLSAGEDLLAYYAEDGEVPAGSVDGCPSCNREFTYEVFNSGNTVIRASRRWHVLYMLYNAMNAGEYEIIYEDYYTDEYGAPGDFGELSDSKASADGYWNYIDVAKGENPMEGFDPIAYTMPSFTGKYYLVVMADAYDVIREVNEDNNFYFISAANGKPLELVNGEIRNMPQPKMSRSAVKRPAPEPFSDVETQTLVKPGNLNAYTPSELKTMLLHDKKSGKLDAKIRAFAQSDSRRAVKRVKKPAN